MYERIFKVSMRYGTMAAVAILMAGTVPAAADRDVVYPRDDRETRHEGPYVTGFVGGALGGEVDFDNTFEVDLESGLLFGGTLGFDNLFAGAGGDVRVEAEVSHRTQELDGLGDDVNLTAVMGNAWYDFDMGGPFVPYAGGGLGVGFVDDEVDEATGFAYQFGGGINYHMSPSTMLGFNYRYLRADFEVDDVLGNPEIDYSGHQLSASLGYKF